jgi:hypothetical protein
MMEELKIKNQELKAWKWLIHARETVKVAPTQGHLH